MAETADRRAMPRARTRLRPGKLLDADGRFLADCAILDRSAGGVRIGCFEAVAVPERCRLLDESDASSVAVSPVWRRVTQSGLRLEGACEPLERRDYLLAAGPYYAVR